MTIEHLQRLVDAAQPSRQTRAERVRRGIEGAAHVARVRAEAEAENLRRYRELARLLRRGRGVGA